MKQGLLLINLGTPAAPNTLSVGRYLQEFLSDKRIITLPSFLRYLLLYGLILPLRTTRSTKAYQTIWTQDGSPLLINSQKLIGKLQKALGKDWLVVLGMRYGKPSLETALEALRDCERLIILPLYPQYSSSATGSSIEKTLGLLAKQTIQPSLTLIRDFYQHPGFIEAQAALIKPHLPQNDFILFSFHGIPEHHLKAAGCLSICQTDCPAPNTMNSNCYRAQCYATSSALALSLDLKREQYAVAFQSRLGKTPWIKPYTDHMLPELAAKGIKRLAIACPSFVADCLETLEEMGYRAREQWTKLGGESLTLIPCVNDDDAWVQGILKICGLKPPISLQNT